MTTYVTIIEVRTPETFLKPSHHPPSKSIKRYNEEAILRIFLVPSQHNDVTLNKGPSNSENEYIVNIEL